MAITQKIGGDLDVSVVIPCFNEAEGLRSMIPQLQSVANEIIVIDNGSTDNTAEVARAMGARVAYEDKKGYGWAYQRGLPLAGSRIIATLDGDGTYPVEAIPEVINYMQESGKNFINCARFPLSDRLAMHTKNYYSNLFTSMLVRRLFNCKLKDAMTGMWIFHRDILEKIMPHAGGMEFSLAIKLSALFHESVRFEEYHIQYSARVGSPSKYRPIKDSINVATTVARLWKQFRKRKEAV